jgi:hypothetical protein
MDFDGERSWVRFWLLGIISVVRTGADPNHARAAFGRVVAETVFWAPAALLPRNGAIWEQVSDDTVRATASCRDMIQTVDITVSKDGKPHLVAIPRWNDANPEKKYQIQPFGGYASEFREFAGYTLLTRVEGGNFVGS